MEYKDTYSSEIELNNKYYKFNVKTVNEEGNLIVRVELRSIKENVLSVNFHKLNVIINFYLYSGELFRLSSKS